jgi:nucleotide-binding universal stress UspA family protein
LRVAAIFRGEQTMTMIQNILFPVDFSPACVAMVPFVKREADLFSARVTILHVLEPPASGFELYARPLPAIEEDRRLVGRKRLHSFLESEFPSPVNSRLFCEGDVATRISEIALERKFDLIVMPTHAGVFRRMLLGSTTAKVLNYADCPVLTTRHAETIQARPLEHREWACAVGLSTDSQRVLRYAVQMAAEVHANLSVIHAIQASETPIQFDLEERVESAARREARGRIDELQTVIGSHAPVHITTGPIKEGLLHLVRRLRADALVIGRSAQPGVAERLRDLTYAVVRDAPCPVVSV